MITLTISFGAELQEELVEAHREVDRPVQELEQLRVLEEQVDVNENLYICIANCEVLCLFLN